MPETNTAALNRRQQKAILRKQKQRRQRLVLGGASLLIAGAIGGGVILTTTKSSDKPDLRAVQSFEHLKPTHVTEPVNYEQSPPTGGDHAPVWQNCGSYSKPIANEQGVHSMEHGAVWITYRPDLPQDEINSLRSLSLIRDYLLVSPSDGLDSPVVASAWGKQIKLESAADKRLDAFIRQYMKGAQTPEPGAPCSSGDGTPT